ncbi:hypothetical protein [Microcoleus sp. CAWBG58]|nr:hypothetical protein [Microcoleus sp. CAWBG58]
MKADGRRHNQKFSFLPTVNCQLSTVNCQLIFSFCQLSTVN